MTYKCIRILLLLGLFLSASQSTYADALAISTLNLGNLQITPTTGFVQFAGSWQADAFAQASNSLGELDVNFDSNTGGTATANAVVTFASAQGMANASGLVIACAANVNIPGCLPRSASSIGRGSLANSFTITGGTGAVDVNISAMLDGMQHVLTDICGELAESEVIFTLEVADSFGNTVFSLSFNSLLTIGRSAEIQSMISQAVANTAHLQFDTEYSIFIETDTESRGITSPVPEPSTMVLLLSGLSLIAGFVRKRTTVTATYRHKKGWPPDE